MNSQNKKRKIIFQLKEGDKVYLLGKNIKKRKKYRKLDYVKIEIFFIKAKNKTLSFKQKLSKNVKLYFVFYVLLLKITDFKILIQNMFHY